MAISPRPIKVGDGVLRFDMSSASCFDHQAEKLYLHSPITLMGMVVVNDSESFVYLVPSHGSGYLPSSIPGGSLLQECQCISRASANEEASYQTSHIFETHIPVDEALKEHRFMPSRKYPQRERALMTPGCEHPSSLVIEFSVWKQTNILWNSNSLGDFHYTVVQASGLPIRRVFL